MILPEGSATQQYELSKTPFAGIGIESDHSGSLPRGGRQAEDDGRATSGWRSEKEKQHVVPQQSAAGSWRWAMRARIGVIGAGVMGTVGASELSNLGHEVTIFTYQQPEETLSQRVLPAIVLPCVAAWTDDREQIATRGLEKILQWEERSLVRFREQSDREDSAVSSCKTTMLFDRDVGEHPYWRDQYPDFHRANPGEMPDGFKHGWSFVAYVIDTKRWLGNILRQITGAGGHIEVLSSPFLSLLPDNRHFDGWLVCPGIGSRQLFPEDQEIYGSRGQLVEVQLDALTGSYTRALIHAPESVEFQNLHTFEYIIPIHDDRGRFATGRFVLGGTMEPVNDTELLLEQTPDTVVSEAIVDKCVKIMPQLSRASVLRKRVGIRPCRKNGIRIERDERFPKIPVIVAYGTGSDGFSLHECMRDAVDLLVSAI
jgi:D-amino-acid oxidase